MKKKIVSLLLVIALLATAVIGGTLAYFTDTDEVKNEFTMGKVDIDLYEHNGVEKVDEGIKYDAPIVPGHVFEKDPTIDVLANSEESYVFLDMSFNKYSSLFWVMAADAAADESINLPLYNEDGTLAADFQNGSGVFGTTKFLEYMVANPATMRAIVNKWFTGIEHENWEICDVIMKAPTANYITFRFVYKGDVDGTANYTVSKNNEIQTIPFMGTFGMPTSVTQEMIQAGTEIGKMQNNFNTEQEAFHMDFMAYAIQADTLTLAAAYEALFEMELDDVLISLAD